MKIRHILHSAAIPAFVFCLVLALLVPFNHETYKLLLGAFLVPGFLLNV